jgi:hypothetical protein
MRRVIQERGKMRGRPIRALLKGIRIRPGVEEQLRAAGTVHVNGKIKRKRIFKRDMSAFNGREM